MVIIELGIDDAVASPRRRLLAVLSWSARPPDDGRIANVDTGIVERRTPGFDDAVRSRRGMSVHDYGPLMPGRGKWSQPGDIRGAPSFVERRREPGAGRRS